ncbi:MAG: hypothetical protein RJB38_1084 [Pseudomonadota bacterium]
MAALGLSLSACQQSGAVPASVIGITEPKSDSSGTPSGVVGDATQYYSGPAELAGYVSKFISDAAIQGVNVTSDMSGPQLSLRIASLDSYGSSVIGLCERSSNLRRVTLDPDFWNVVDETQRELLVHHELGHCVLSRGHRTEVLSSGLYASLMYPIIMRSSSYTSNYDYYQQELFQYAAQGQSSSDEDPNRITVHVCDVEELGRHDSIAESAVDTVGGR